MTVVSQYCLPVYVGSIIISEKKGKLLISHRSTIYPCCLPALGEFDRSWSYKTYPLQRYDFFLLCKDFGENIYLKQKFPTESLPSGIFFKQLIFKNLIFKFLNIKF